MIGMVRMVGPWRRSKTTSWLDSLKDSVCSRKLVEDFWDVRFSCVTVEGSLVGSNIDVLYCNLFPVLVCYLEVEDVGFMWLLEMLCL